MQESSWSLGTLIGLPVIAVSAVAALVLGSFLIRHARNANRYDVGMFKFFGYASFTTAATIVAIGALGFYPYSAEYHKWSPVSGEVTAISSRLVTTGSGDSAGVSQRFVVDIAGVGQRACDDTRCATVEVGDALSLSCKREWQFTGTDGFGCNFVSNEAKS